MKYVFGIIILLVSFSFSQEISFIGFPVKKIEIVDSKPNEFELSSMKSKEYFVKIEKVGEKYYWASRSNKELILSISGLYQTFHAIDGSGYIRVLSKEAREVFNALTEKEKSGQYVYIEHLVHQMSSITYYGVEK